MGGWADFISGGSSVIDFLNRISQIVFNRAFWIRLGVGMAGLVLMVLGIVIMLRRKVTGSIGEVAKVAAVAA
jgi:hypothetical protein